MAYCEKCGAKLDDGYAFCAACGTKRNDLSEHDEVPSGEEKKTKRKRKKSCSEPTYIESHTVGGSGNIMLCSDGKYRWVYEFSMLRNPTLYFTVLKVLTIGALCCTLFVIATSIGSEGLGAFIEGAKVFGIGMVIFVPLSFLSYLILAAQYGWKYIVLFEMDENGIIHQQQDKQFDKAKGIAWLNAFIGAARNDIGAVGRSISVMTNNSTSSEFGSVKKVTLLKRRNTIKLDQPLSHNQVYVENEDWDFIENYIVERCTNAKIRH